MTRIAPILLCGLALASPAAAQEVIPIGGAAPAWLGVTYDLRWVQVGTSCASHVLVDGVIPGSPAERAGLRAGDVVVAINGDNAPGRQLQLLSIRLTPGDSIRLRVDRAGALREVTAVADRRPNLVPNPPRRAEAPDRGRDAPVIHVRGDTLMATNVEALGAAVRTRSPGYWLTRADGRTTFRSLAGRPSSDLDQRVTRLLACAESEDRRIVTISAQAEQIQERAESLRVAIAHRALERREGEVRVVPARPGAPNVVAVPGAPPAVPVGAAAATAAGREVMVFRAEDALAASLRGVVGAEVVVMEPELAAYFRGVDAGLLVLRVAPGTVAARSGLRPGDVITDIGGRPASAATDLRAMLATPGAGATELAVVRQGRKRTVTVPRP